jgi:DNA-binding MarR family transcriptional regulator
MPPVDADDGLRRHASPRPSPRPWWTKGVVSTAVHLFKLLTAVGTRAQHEEPPFFTSEAIATRLGVSESEAENALRQAERDGWVAEEHDESRHVGPDFNRQVWHLTDGGREELSAFRTPSDQTKARPYGWLTRPLPFQDPDARAA